MQLRKFYVAHLRETPLGSVLRFCRRAVPTGCYSIENLMDRAMDFLYRASYVRRYYWRRIKPAFRWLFDSRETSNFTYDLSPHCKLYLADMLSVATGCGREALREYIAELEGDAELRETIVRQAEALPRYLNVDPSAKYGRRVGWYALARALKPRIVVETGVDKGLGSTVLCAALRRNAQEGHPGRYFGTDLNPSAGALLTGPYSDVGTVLYGDSIESLKKLGQSIDLFINDSDHSAEYERREYQTIFPMLSSGGIIVGDNAHATEELAKFSSETGRGFLFWREEPLDHWYLGAGIGLSFPMRH